MRNWFNQQTCKYLHVNRIVRVKSWLPTMGPYGVEWPVLLVDRDGGQRDTIAPVWNWARVKQLFQKNRTE